MDAHEDQGEQQEEQDVAETMQSSVSVTIWTGWITSLNTLL